MIRNILDYAAAAWQPFLSPTKFEKLEVVHNRCLRLITAQYANTYMEILRLEAGILSYRTYSDRLTAIAYEKGKRFPAGHPRRQAVDGQEEPVAHRSKVRSSFRKHAEELVSPLSLSGLPHKPVLLPFHETWDEPEPERNWTIHINETIKHDIPAIGRLVDSLLADVNIYTDDSCKDGTRDGGAAAVCTFGTFDDPQRLEVVKAKGDTHTLSYNEEMRPLNLGIDWLSNAPLVEHCTFLTDSLSLLQVFDNEDPKTAEIRSRLQPACNRVDLLYVPDHKDIPGNEMADMFAKEAARGDGPPRNKALSLRTAKVIIRREIADPPTIQRLASQFYAEVSQERDHAEIKSRKDADLLAQLRAGHQKSLGYYQHFVGVAENDACECCTTVETDNTAHWLLRCPSTSAARQHIFGTHSIRLVELRLAPAKIVELARCTFSL
jgi:ribonuclease HI